MEFKDYYEILGVEASAGEAELKTAYRRLARKYHPDVSKEKGAEEKFKSINEAYEVLRDKEKRQEYDQLRARGYRSGQEYQPPPGFGAGGGFQPGFGSAQGSGDFSDFFESLFGGGRARPSQQPLGDTRAKVAIPLEIAFSGGQQRFNVDGRTLEVKIPAGIKPGQVIRLAGQGRSSGARKSDLLLEIDYRPHADFEVDDRNILYTLSLAPWEAALGTTAAVPTLGGTVDLKIPADSDAGKKLRLRGRGLPGKSGAGDQIVEIEIRAPKAESDEQKDLYKKMAEVFSGQ
ncbi:MAG TPA: DnaJ C-terminal domain-containing protein [Arenimonas sp.]|nr:DnaJ C-terminal domain-containing protein [Arenimonas sp.]HOZ05553.1 DnaJ C-terminal domain-containing protein [Arenimonas sp.]HPO23601.1 DnaJ C-terminal domain-containing protein [Arenimonas sp.]HPW31970.1 DnaJ C-terminal domain-containing protein [Arenimonas sp.]